LLLFALNYGIKANIRGPGESLRGT